MKNCNIAILGATGAVGREMLNVLEEYDITEDGTLQTSTVAVSYTHLTLPTIA